MGGDEVETMTYSEACTLADGTPIRLDDGRTGRVVVWHHATESIGVTIDGGGTRRLPCECLRYAADGVVEAQSSYARSA
jgi:hypothetical protein